jgi:GNAT superfamily N-acetyltransferase
MQRGEYRTWLVAVDGEVVAGVGLWLLDWPPGPTDASCRRAFVYNVYTRPDYRRRRLARRLMAEVIDWCQAQHLTELYLHASDEGRALYESLGFEPTTEMRLCLDEQPPTPAGGRAHPR